MTHGIQTHPTHEQLAAFGAGRLGDAESVAVEEHLADCVACCESLKEVPSDDSYVCLLREAGSDANLATLLFTPTVAAAGAETDGLHDAKPQRPLPAIPPELAEHPRYRVVRLLGSGGMGAVYEAEHRLMRRRVALKIIKPEWFRHPAAVARFRREMQAAARLVHPHVVTAFDAEQAGEVHFLAMEFFDGLTLAELVQQRGPLPVDMACECIRQAALGLQQAHEQGMVHRDIKPGNLMVSRDARVSVKILDFGLARFASEAEDDGRETSVNTMLGTPDFMAPEQARDARSADIRSDIYSLGCTLHFLLTGEVPHPGLATAIERAIAHLEREPLPASTFRSDIPDGLREVLPRMIAKRPSDRFQTPAELAAALAPFADPTHAAPLLLSPQEVLPQRSLAAGFQRVLMALGLVGFVLLMAVIVHVVTDKGDLRIRTETEGAVILLRQNGQVVRRIETQLGEVVTRLPCGEYSLELNDAPSNVRLSSTHVVVSRGRVSDLTVSREDK